MSTTTDPAHEELERKNLFDPDPEAEAGVDAAAGSPEETTDVGDQGEAETERDSAEAAHDCLAEEKLEPWGGVLRCEVCGEAWGLDEEGEPSPDVPLYCRGCGCTDLAACEEPCGWAEGTIEDHDGRRNALCTNCAPSEEAGGIRCGDFRFDKEETVELYRRLQEEHGERALDAAIRARIEEEKCSNESAWTRRFLERVDEGIRPAAESPVGDEKEAEEPAPEKAAAPSASGAERKALRRARRLDGAISAKDSEIDDLKQELKGAREEREQLVSELRRCIREAGQGELFDTEPGDGKPNCARCEAQSTALSAGREGTWKDRPLCPDCLGQVFKESDTSPDSAEEEVEADSAEGSSEPPSGEEAEEPPVSRDQLRFTQKKVAEAFDELVEQHGEATVLWTLAGGKLLPDGEEKKLSMPAVRELAKTLEREPAAQERESRARPRPLPARSTGARVHETGLPAVSPPGQGEGGSL